MKQCLAGLFLLGLLGQGLIFLQHKREKDIPYNLLFNKLSSAKTYLKQESFNKAKKRYLQIIEYGKGLYNIEEAQFMLSELFRLTGDYQSAIKGYKKHLKDYPFGDFAAQCHKQIKELQN